MAYPIARLLEARKVPFVFMTGYGPETISAPFPGVQVFQKPLEREVLRQFFAVTPSISARANAATLSPLSDCITS